jgi:hypothetical protein
MKAKIALGVCLAVFPLIAFSATEFSIKIKNKSNYDAFVMSPSGNEDWHCGDLCIEQIVKAHSTAKFYTHTRALSYNGTAIQNINIRYGQRNAIAQMWIDHDHTVDENVKTTIIHLSQTGVYYDSDVYANVAGIATDSENISTDIYAEKMNKAETGVANITLTLN